MIKNNNIQIFTASNIDTPIGEMVALFSNKKLIKLVFTDDYRVPDSSALQYTDNEQTKKLKQELTQYFSGECRAFSVPIALYGTNFQQQVWRLLQRIPYGKTCTYGEQATQMGKPKAQRAVGVANSKNPISIVIPCHRVIGKGGFLTGYAGGIERKKYLLELEAMHK